MPHRLGGRRVTGRRGLLVTSFSQSLGSELLTNGDFSAWTGDNPNGWTVSGESGSDPMVTQVAPDGSAGTGAARFYSSATTTQPRLSQTVLVISSLYELQAELSAWTAGLFNVADGSGNAFTTFSSSSTKWAIGRATSGTLLLRCTGAAPYDAVLNTIFAKRLTLNTANQVGTTLLPATFYVTLPGSPVTGQTVFLWYRGIASNDELNNGWAAKLVYSGSQWQAGLDSYSSGTATARIALTNVGTPDSIRVRVTGDTHQLFTGLAGTFTQRGADVTNTTHNTGTWVNTIYSSAVTPVRLEVS